MNSVAGAELTLPQLLPPAEAERLCASLGLVLESPVALLDRRGDVLAGSRGLAGDDGAELVLELEPIGRLRAPQAAPVRLAAAAAMVRQLLMARARYLMAAEVHLASTQADYDELQRQNAALRASEAKYRSLAGELEARVAEQVKLIDERQRQLYQAEKLASVGQLAAGVAHEINNPIGFVRSNLNTAGKYLERIGDLAARVATLPGGPELLAASDAEFTVADFADLLRDSIGGIDRVARIVSDLKGFSNVDKPEEEVVAIADLLELACTLVEKKLPAGARLLRDFAPLPPQLCLPGHLSQAFLAVIGNAAQAVAARGGDGEVVVSTRADADTTVVEVRDNGVGIAPEDLPKVFDPFFTTRPVGQGTGLGLTVARDIVGVHGGSIAIASEPDAGTTVTLRLPA